MTQIAAPIATARAELMFWLAVVFLLLLGLLLPHGGFSDEVSGYIRAHDLLVLTFALIWLAIACESVLGLWQGRYELKGALRRWLLIAAIPAFRITVATAHSSAAIWLPRFGWQATGQRLFDELEARFTTPMLAITLLILPIMGIEFLLKQRLEHWPALGLAMHIGTVIIWFAFALEFIIMVTVAERKVAYCKKNWINIVIIVLPLVAFLRTLRLFQVLRMTKAGKLLRIYRLRGLLVRAQRLALLVNLLERYFLRNPDNYLQKLREQEQDKLRELHDIRRRIRKVQAQIAARGVLRE